MDDVKVENVPYNVIPVTEYDPFEAKFSASLFWLVFRVTEDGEFDNIPSQVTSPIQRDSEKRITVRPEVTEFLTNGEIYCKVCDSIFHGKVPVVGQWAIIQTLSRHGFYVVEEGDIAVTESALQQKKPFRKSTHLALMDCLMSAFSARAVTVQQVVQSVSKFSSFNASKELPFDMEDALLLWMNKLCAALNENQLKKQKQHAEQLLQNQDKAKRFRFRRDQLQPKVQMAFPLMEELLKDISDGKSLLGIILFYHPTVINLEDVRFDTNLSTEDYVHNLDLFRSLCSQFICTSVLALKVEDLLYGSQAMKPNIIALLAEIFHKCEMESLTSENGVIERQTSKSDVDLRYIVANKENVVDNKSSSAPVLNSDKTNSIERGSPRESFQSKSERSSLMYGPLSCSALESVRQENTGSAWKSQSDSQVNSNSRLSFKSPFHLDFTVDYDAQQPPLNGPVPKQGIDNEKLTEKDNPFSGIFQRPVLAGESRKHSLPINMPGGYGSPRTTPRQDVPLLMRRNKQKQRTLDLEEWDMQQEEVEELHVNDLQRSQSLTGLDKAKVEPRQSFHAWREDTGASLSDTNLSSSRNKRISLDFRSNLTSSVPQRDTEGGIPQRGTQGIHVPMMLSGSKAKREEHTSQDSLSSSPKSTDSLNMRPTGDKPRERQHSLLSGVRDSCTSDMSAKELNQFEEIEAMILAGRSVETPRRFVKPSKLGTSVPDEEEDLNTSVSSEDMNKFRLEVLQRLTEDKLREIPDGAEMEDDDDPIRLARNNAAVNSPRNPPEQCTRLEVPDLPTEIPTDQLSPITETTEPCPSVASNPNSVSSANSTAPSSPCSPLDVAPFMPAFFTTSPANTLDRKKQRLSMKDREDTTERTLVAEEEDDDFPSDPETSATPRFQAMSAEKSREFPSRSKSFEQLTRGSYTVDHVSAESAKAAGIPVINASSEEIRGRADSANSQSSYLDSSDVFHSRKLSQKETNSSRDLSGFRPLVLSSAGGESNEAFPAEGVDGRRDSLESSPAHSPALTRGRQDDTRQEAAFRSRDMTAQDSPGDVVIFERSLSSSHGTKGNFSSEDFIPQTNENAQRHSATVTRPKKTEAYVFDFNQDVVQHYESDPVEHDFRTFKKGKKPGDLADGSNLSQGECSGEQGTQQDGHGTHEHSHPNQHQTSAVKEFTSPVETNPRYVYEEHPGASVNVKDLRESDGLSTFRENTVAEKNEGNVIPETSVKGLDLRRSDGFSTFRKEPTAGVSESLLAQFKTASVHGQRQHEADPFSTFAKSAKKHDGSQHRVQEGMHHSLELEPSAGVSESLLAQFKTASVHGHREHEADPFSTFAKSAKKRDGSLHRAQEGMHPPLELEPTAAVATRPLPSRGGEGEIHTTPRGGEEEEIRVSVSSNITRSRTFRKKPDGQIIHGDNIGASSSPGFDEERSSINNASKLTGQQTVNTHIRDSPEEAGGDNPHRISWTDESEAGARLMRQFNATVDRSTTQESHDTGGSPRRRGSPRQTGRGSPGARISWVTAAKSGVGGQVMLNDKGCMQEDTRTKFVADGLSNERPRFIATAVIRRKHLLHAEGAPWRTNENGAKVPEVLGLRALTRVGPEEQAPVVHSGSLLKAPDTSSTLVNESRSSKEKFEKENNMLSASASEAEPDTRAGGSIRDRIRALTAAAGVSRLGVAQGREQSKKTLPKAATLSSEDETNGRVKPGLFAEASKSSEKPAKTENSQELSQISARNGVAFDVGFQTESKPRPRVLSRFRTSDLDRKDEPVVSDSQVVSSKEIGVTKDTSVAFEVSFEDEPRSKRAKDEPVLLQSPFKALKTRSNLRRQQKSIAKVCQPLSSTSKIGEISSMASSQEDDSKPARNSCTRGEVDENVANGDFTKRSESKTAQKQFKFSFVSESRITERATSEELPVDTASNDLATKQEDLKDKSSFEVPKLLKRNTFTLNSASDQGSPIVKAFNELATKQETVLPPSEHIPKRSTFTFESVSQSIESASGEGLPVANVLNDLASKEEFEQSKLQSDVDSLSPSNEKTQKRNTFTLHSVLQSVESASGEGLPVANVLNDLAKKEEFKQSKLQSDVDSESPSSEKTQKRSTFTLENISKELDSAIEQGGQVSDALQRTVASEKSQKRNTFTLENVSKELDSAIEQGDKVTDALQGTVASEEKKSPIKTVGVDTLTKKDLTSEEKHEPSEKRSTYRLDAVSSSLQTGAKEGLPVTEVLCQLAKRQELQSSGMSGTEESPTQIEPVQKRDTFTLDTVSQTSKDAQSKSLPAEEQIVSVQKRDTFTLDTVSQTSKDAQSKSLPAEESTTQIEPDQKSDTFTLDTVSQTLEDAQSKGLPAVDVLDQLASKHESHLPADTPSEDKLNTKTSQKRDTYTLDTVSHAIEEAVEKGIPVSETLNHLAQEEKPLPGSSPPPAAILKAEMDLGTRLPLHHTPTNGYDDSSAGEVACGLTGALSPDHRDEIEASFEDALEQLEDSLTLVSFPSASDREQSSAARERSSANRKRWSADRERRFSDQERSSADREQSSADREQSSANRKQSSPVREQSSSDREQSSSDRDRSPADREQSSAVRKQSSADREQSSAVREQSSADRKQSSADRKQSSSDRERSSPDRERSSADREQSSANREQSSSETPGNRGTYNLDDVSNSVEDGAQDGVPVADTLERLSRTKTLPKDGVEDSKLFEQRRGTYTLDEVSISLQTASQQGIPVVDALRNMTRAKETVRGTGESAQKRGTYTLNDVSKSLERAKKTGIPVIEALESLSQETPPSPLRLKIPERETYILDEVSLTLEKAQQKGLPVVDALGKLTASKDISLRQTPDAVHRRQKKLVNRKTYALASPLETIGEGAKLRLYDGSQRQMLSPLTLHMKTKEATPTSKVNSSESKARGLGVVQKLDFLTSACELLLEANAKEMAKDRQQTASLPENTRNDPTADESVRRSPEAHPELVDENLKDVKSCTDGSQSERHTYSLESVAQTIDDAKAAGIPVVDALKSVTTVTKPNTTRRTNLMRLNSKSDSELMEGNEKVSPDRYTHSLEDMSRTLEDAQKAGIPVIQALDQLTNELAEFSRTALGEDVQIAPLLKDNRKRKRYSETTIRELSKGTRDQSPYPSPHASPYPPPIRKAYSLDDVAFAVQKAFQSGTSLTDFLDSITSEKPAEPVSSSRDVRPRSVDSGFISSLSDYDISSQSFESPRNRSNTYILDSSNEELDLAKVKESTFRAQYTTQSPMVDQDENRRTFTLDHVSGSVERELSRGIPVIEALERLSNSSALKTENSTENECKENAKNISTELSDKTLVKKSSSGKKQSPPKPKRKSSKKLPSPQSNADAFVIEFFSSNTPKEPNASKFQFVNNKAEDVNLNNNETNAVNPEKDTKSMEHNVKLSDTSPLSKETVMENTDPLCQVSLEKDADLVPARDPESEELNTVSNSAPTRGRATWRPSGSVLDKISSLMDAAEDCGMSASDVLNQVTDLPCEAEGEIEETPQDEVEDEQAVTSQIAYLRMQLEEKRRHIEAEKYRAQTEWEDQRRRLGQTAFWYVIGKAQGGQNPGEGTGSEVLHSDKVPIPKPHPHDKQRKIEPEFPNQPSPPIAWSSPANSPLPASALKPSPSNGTQFETREYRLSDYPPVGDLGTNQNMTRPSSQPAVEVTSRPTQVPPRPSSHDPAASRYTAPARKCWDVDVGQVPTPPPLVHPDTGSVISDVTQESNNVQPQGGGAAEIEVEIHTPSKKGMAMFIGDDTNPSPQGLTPEQERKREKFMKLRQKKQEEDKTRKEAELEKKRRREEKQREKEMLHRMEEERIRQEELERQKAEQELRIRDAQAARVPDSYSTYRRPGPRQHVYDINDDANSYFVPVPAQPSGFADFSGPQCYVKPSGKSNRKIIVNAVSHVCLSGTVNQDQKEKCLQAISESDGHHFMILFKDGLKFRGVYVHNLDNEQLFKIFGIGPRVVTSKMVEGLYKYNSGGKEFTKIPSKTLSISVDGFAIQKSCWHTGKPVVSSKTSSNLKRPPRPPQR